MALPTELLADIFVYACSRPQDDGDHSHYDEYLEPPHSNLVRQVRHVVGATCRRWREVVLSTTQLWSPISVEVALQDNKVHEFYSPPSFGEEIMLTPSLEMLGLELARSGTRPLRLHLFVQHQLEMPAELFELIEEAFPRCVTIYLSIPPLLRFTMPLERPSGELPLLRSLGIDLSHIPANHEINEGMRFAHAELELAPALRYFSASYPILPPPFCAGLALTRLHLDDGVPFSYALSIIALCSQLCQLKWVVKPPEHENIPQKPLHLPLLDKLWFINLGSEPNDSSVLSLINAPRLSTLQLLGGNMLPKQFPSTRRLISATSFIGDEGSFPEALKNFPILEELDISYFRLSETVVEALSHRGSNDEWTLLPHLRHLVWPDDMVDREAVGRLLRARNTDRRGDESHVTLVLDYSGHDDVPPSVDDLGPWVTTEKHASSSYWTHHPFEDAILW